MIEPPSVLHFRLTDYPDAFIRYENPERFHPALEGYLLENYGVFLPVRIRHCQYPWLTNGWDDGDELFSFVILSTACISAGFSGDRLDRLAISAAEIDRPQHQFCLFGWA
jgi:hypothetical protein